MSLVRARTSARRECRLDPERLETLDHRSADLAMDPHATERDAAAVQKPSDPLATIGLDIGKNTFHLFGLDKRGAIVMRCKVSRSQLLRRLANLPPLPLEAGCGSRHIARA